MKFRRHVGLGYGSFWRGIIFDREYKNLSDIILQSKKFFLPFKDGAKFHASASDLKWVWPTGEELLLRYVKRLSDYENYHGHEYAYIGFNELTKHPTSELYDNLLSTNRTSFIPEIHTPKDDNDEYATPDKKPLPDIPLIVFSTTNPSGPGHNWVKKLFINCAPVGTVVKNEMVVFDPRIQAERTVVKKQIAIFGSYKENKYLAPEYIAYLHSITDPHLKAAWLYGSWDIPAGGAFDDLWRPSKHVVPHFKIPRGWYIDRAFDWGSTHPFSVGWFAEANGEEVTLPDGTKFCPKAGSIIQFAEWYGTREIGRNKGLKMSASDIAKGIVLREQLFAERGWLSTKPKAGPADNQISNVTEVDVETIADKMRDEGVAWLTSDKSSGSRTNGFQLFRDRLESTLRQEGPGFYVMANCSATIELLPGLPRDEKKLDDVDTDAEDHVWDMIRYRTLHRKIQFTEEVNVRSAH